MRINAIVAQSDTIRVNAHTFEASIKRGLKEVDYDNIRVITRGDKEDNDYCQ